MQVVDIRAFSVMFAVLFTYFVTSLLTSLLRGVYPLSRKGHQMSDHRDGE